MNKLLIATSSLLLLTLTGCASNYDQYAQAQIEVAKAQAEADKARYQALLAIADSGDEAAKVAAVMSIQMGQLGGNQQRPIAAPKSASDTALQWAGVLVPGLTQAYGIYAQTELGKVQSNNSTAVAITQSDNNADITMHSADTNLGIAELITIPEAVVVEHTTETVTVVEQPAPIIVEQPSPIIVDPTVVNPLVVETTTNNYTTP